MSRKPLNQAPAGRVEWPDVPPSLNKVLRMHWTARMKEKLKWMTVLRTMPRDEYNSLVRARSTANRVKMLITLHNARQFDRDNAFGACKLLVDAAKNAYLIYDDRPAYLDLEVQQVKCKRAEKKTVIEFEVLA